ncbi:hypothetical protein AB0P15_29820 [Streptomyces sp. NPDC087917]|uniref:hypothetical protein n=1 Tax=Streptomyces sp. NPDC087917 TaxID=3155060 RepID=UPI00342B8AAC
MFHSSDRSGRPADRTWQETLRRFGGPVVELASPEPGWRRLDGLRSVDDHLHRIDLGYHEQRTMVVQVTTQRRLPEHVRVFGALEPDGLLADFLDNCSPDGPIRPLDARPDRMGRPHSEDPFWLPDVVAAGTGPLVLDGTAIEGRRFTYGGHVVTLAVIGERTVAVTSAADLHAQAVHLITVRAVTTPAS